MNVCTYFHGNLLLKVTCRGKVWGSPKSCGFILWGPWMSAEHLIAIHPELVIHCSNYNHSISNISHVAVVVEVILLLSRGSCDMHGNNCLPLHNVIHCRRTVYCKTFFVVYRIQHMPHQIAHRWSFLTDCLQISAEMKSLHDISLSPPEGHAVKPHMCRGS